jgi:gliding motility-associated-like protein
MEWRKITLLVLMVNTFCFGQEICNNAIDDDGDGQTDINDAECICATSNANNALPSLIPNASFEEYNNCPTGPSQLDFAQNWVQCTTATADYMNTCGYVFEAVTTAGLAQFPDGNGIAGTIISKDFKEYIGTDLVAPLLAGKSYTISFNIASLPVNGDGNTCNNGIINYGALNITVYGSSNTGSLPLNTTGAPTTSTQWIELDHSTYQPVSTWGVLSITFTPSANINSIMIGAPETLPASYDNNSCYPYFLYDALSISEASNLTASITPTGAFCSGDLYLHANTNLNVTSQTTYQWYKEGVAVTGATAPTLAIASDISRLGAYNVVISNGNNCVMSSPYSVAQYLQEPVVAQIQPDCNNGTAIITVEDTAHQYSFDNGATWTNSNISTALIAGTYNVKAKSTSGCISNSVAVTVDPYTIAPPIAEDIYYYCQNSIAEALTASGQNLLWYTTPTGGTGTTKAPVPFTDKAGTQMYYVSQTLNGCESDRIAINIIVNRAPEAPHTDDYVEYYYNDYATALSAYGENLAWYDTNGNMLSVAPTPQTSETGRTVYYVTQTVNGCESKKARIIVEVLSKEVAINYPKFFTPNGDGVHEQWNISPVGDDTEAEVYIYDRNGQFITQLTSKDNGWDGTFNGRNLPASDYWFKVVYTEFGNTKEFVSHFSLVR